MEFKSLPQLNPPLESDDRRGASITTVVLHWTAGGSLSGSISTLRQRKLAYHILIGRNEGEGIHQCIPLYRAGRHVGWDVKYLVMSRGPEGKGTVNHTSIGISFANRGDGEPLTPYQEQAVRAIIRYLLRLQGQGKKGFALKWVTTHHECAPRSRPTELKNYPLEKLAAEVGLTAWRRS